MTRDSELSGSSSQSRPAATDAPMTLLQLLEVFRSGAVSATRQEVSPGSLLDGLVDQGLQEALLRAIRKEVGPSAADLAIQSLRGKPLTNRTAERVVEAAMKMSDARRLAFLSAGLSPSLHAPPPAAGKVPLPGEQRADARWMSAAMREKSVQSQPEALPAAVPQDLSKSGGNSSPPSHAPVSPSAEFPRTQLAGRDAALLEYCVGLVRDADADVDDAAKRLHDRVRSLLERSGRWPLESLDDYEKHAKPAAIVLAAWDAPE